MPLKFLSNFWITLDIPLINWEISLVQSWSDDCLITYREGLPAQGGNPVIAGIDNPTNATFRVKNKKVLRTSC